MTVTDTLIYTGVRFNGKELFHIFHKVDDDYRPTGEALNFGKSKNLKGLIVGVIYEIPRTEDGWLFGKKKHTTAKSLVSQEAVNKWRMEDHAADEEAKTVKALKDAHKLENMTLKELKESLKSSRFNVRQNVIRKIMVYLSY